MGGYRGRVRGGGTFFFVEVHLPSLEPACDLLRRMVAWAVNHPVEYGAFSLSTPLER